MTLKLEGFEPVATKLETQQFSTFHVDLADSIKLQALPTGAKLFTASQMQQVIDQCNAKDEEIEDNKEQFDNKLSMQFRDIAHYKEQLASAQAYAERLRDALQKFNDECIESGHGSTEYVFEALATTFRSDALREYGAKLVERIAERLRNTFEYREDTRNEFSAWIALQAGKIRKGKF